MAKVLSPSSLIPAGFFLTGA